jgi:hypothetical protein
VRRSALALAAAVGATSSLVALSCSRRTPEEGYIDAGPLDALRLYSCGNAEPDAAVIVPTSFCPDLECPGDIVMAVCVMAVCVEGYFSECECEFPLAGCDCRGADGGPCALPDGL